jgi:hypothetical protein
MHLGPRRRCGLDDRGVRLCENCFIRFFVDDIPEERNNTFGIKLVRNDQRNEVGKVGNEDTTTGVGG